MIKYNYYCDVCSKKITKQNKIKNKKIMFSNIISTIILDFDFFVREKYEDKICKHCHNVLKNVILKLKKEGEKNEQENTNIR